MAKTPSKTPSKTPNKKSSSLETFFKRSPKSPTRSAAKSPTKAASKSPTKSTPKSPSRDSYPSEPCDIAPGWTMKTVPRRPGSQIAKDRFYYDPEGNEYRSRKEALRSLGVTEEKSEKKRGRASAGKKDEPQASPGKSASNGRSKSPRKTKVAKYPTGTVLSKRFPDQDASDGERSFSGTITEFDAKNGLYKIVYEDEDEEELSEGEVDKLVKPKGKAKKPNGKTSSPKKAAASPKKPAAKPSPKKPTKNDAPKFQIGSKVTKEFHDDEFDITRPWDGSITGYNSSTKKYTIFFPDDSYTEAVTEKEIAEIFVPTYKKGTKVKKYINDGDDDEEVLDGMVGTYDVKVGMYQVHYKNLTSENMTEGEVEGILADRPRGAGAKKADSDAKEVIKKAAKKKGVKKMDTTDEEESSSESVEEKKLVAANGRRRASKKVNYKLEDSDDEPSSEEDKPKAKKAKKATPKKPVAKGKGKKKDDSDSDDFAPGEESEDDVLMDDAVPSDDDEEEDFEDKKPAKKKVAAKKTATKKSADIGGKSKMSEVSAKDCTNNPGYFRMSRKEIKETQTFLDPCGMEATDDIIDRLVGHQLDKIRGLLGKAFQGDALGSQKNPLVLGTACSGTDAPALALMLVQEQLEARGMGGLFKHKHVFSCEKEPYKQAYLAKNFDSVLYPDIVKLCDEPPRDVYGQEQPLPDFNIFVAGTSCKNFSMMMSNKRLDIEDHGCSGETFLAACELLMKDKPKFAIFENVTKAPWEKMSEYITGRLKLSSVDSSNKSIKGASKGKEGELELIWDGEKILTHKVPSQVGVQCGTAIKGYTKGASRTIHDVTWPSSSKKTCTLTEFMKHNKIDKKTDTLYLETDVVYCTHWVKVDTKQFGLPQTRERTYMFVWQPEDGNVDDDLGKYWEAVVNHLQFPVRHALESFILEANHDVIRVFREALNGPAGRYTMRAVNQAPDFWDKANANANLPHNLNTRAAMGMDEYARPQTKWGPYGKMQVPPHWWLEYIKCKEQRCVDMIDILHAAAARDAESHDSNFASYFWNISQNVSREKHRTLRSGIAGCITPGGDVFLPHQGRPLLGCEKLLLQGIPYFRLLLGNETEVQLGDLAGNAMSLTVVNATLLAAMTCKQLRKEHEKSSKKNISDTLKALSKADSALEAIDEENAMEIDEKAVSATSDTTTLFQTLSNLSDDAIKSSIWCTCETSGRKARTCQFVQCRLCGVACCRDCCHVDQGYQLDSHDIKDVSLEEGHDPSSFEVKLRGILPASLSLCSDGISGIASISKDKYRVAGLAKYTYSLHQIKQSRMRWLAVYYARDEKTSEALAELKIIVGKLEQKTDSADQIVGVQCELTSFVPAKREPFQFGPMEVCATARQCHGEKELTWKVRDADTITTLSVVGTNESPSFRIQVGLNDDAVKGQRIAIDTQKKQYQEAKARGEERRWLYTKNWKVWPQVITISDDTVLSGTYTRINCQQTLNQSACWIRKQTNDSSELYFLLKPDVGRIGPDVAIISSSTNYTDTSSILATFPLDWQPCDSFDTKKQSVSEVSVSNYKNLSMTCSAFNNTFSVESPKVDDSPLFVKVNGLSEKDVSDLCCRDDEPGLKSVVSLNVHRGAKAQQTVRRFNLLCVAPILKHAAADGLKYELSLNSTWNKIEPTGDSFGLCLKTLPPRPVESWSFDTERGVWERKSEPGASRQYVLALQEAPQCFRFLVDRNERSLVINCHPEVAAHHAAYGLIDGRGDGLERGVSVKFRLLSVQEDPVLDRFRLHNCHDLPETQVPLRGQYELYERQKKAVTKMKRIENGEVDFEEIEMNEQTMPGATGWSIIARASRMTKLRGGVIADAIGAGKTVISIAIILQGIAAAREKRSFPRKTSASLVVVPPGLIDQWKREVQKFTSEMPKVICIYDDTAIKNTSLQQILDADMVICPVDLLEAKGYMGRLARISADVKDEKEVPQLPKETGQVEKNGASGVWIPATSQDPFGGANNPRSQQRRNESAYFTHVYHDYIRKLREKEFEPQQKGIPLEYFEWERVFIDEIHECLCTSKDELKEAKASKDDSTGFFKEKNRRAGREFLGITTKDTSKRPLVFRRAIFGLTATPLLDSTNRVIELANLMGNAYIIGLSSHWRNLERESGRDIFLSNFLEPKQSREIRKNIYSKCQDYLDRSCCKNKNEEDMEGIEKIHVRETINMSEEEGVLYKKSQSGMTVPSYSTKVEDFDVTAGHDISKFLRQNASLVSRGKKLVEICKSIISKKGNEHTKIIVFADGRIGAGNVARDFLMKEEGLGCTWLDESDTVQEKNQKLAWYQYADVTEEDKKRPRVLVLHFEHAAGLNLQAECNNLILFTPLYVGDGGTSGDVVADVSTEMQAIGRVFRPGQPKPKVFIYRIEVRGPSGEECLDGQLIRRNTDKDTEQMAVNADD